MRLKGDISGLNTLVWRRRGRGHSVVFRELVRQGRLGVDRQHGAILLVVFWRVGLGIVMLCNFELIDAGEKHRWLFDCNKISLRNLVHFLPFSDLSC